MQKIYVCKTGEIQRTNRPWSSRDCAMCRDNSPFARPLLATLHPLGKVTAMTVSYAQHLTQSQVTLPSGSAPDTTPAFKALAKGSRKYRTIKHLVMASSIAALLLAVLVASYALRETKHTNSLSTGQSTAPVAAVSPASLQALASAYKQNQVKGSIFPAPATH